MWMSVSPCPKAVARRAAEEAWEQLHQTHGVPVHIFRLGGMGLHSFTLELI